MQAAIAENFLSSLVDWVFISDFRSVKQYVETLRANHPGLDRRQLAQKIIDEQAFNHGILGTATGLMSAATLPLMLPLDILKTWKIQDFTIKAIAYVYGHTPQNTDLKTAVFLLLANGSIEELKQFAIQETSQMVTQSAFNAIDSLKTTSIQIAAKETPKLASKAVMTSGKAIVKMLGMGEVAKYLAEALCQVCGKKMAERVLQKSFTLAVPAIGAAIGGGIDWLTTQAVGKLAIEFFENSGMEFLNSLFTITPAEL